MNIISIVTFFLKRIPKLKKDFGVYFMLKKHHYSALLKQMQNIVIRDMATIYSEIMRMEGKAKVESYLKFSKFFFVELPMAIPKESDAERMRRETMEITDKFSEDKIEDTEEV